MAEHTFFIERLRHDLGKRFTVAQEHAPDPQIIYLLVRRQGRPEMLQVDMDLRWLIDLELAFEREGGEGAAISRIAYKHLAVLIARFFGAPALLPDATFAWPGTQTSREALRRTLDPRRIKRSTAVSA